MTTFCFRYDRKTCQHASHKTLRGPLLSPPPQPDVLGLHELCQPPSYMEAGQGQFPRCHRSACLGPCPARRLSLVLLHPCPWWVWELVRIQEVGTFWGGQFFLVLVCIQLQLERHITCFFLLKSGLFQNCYQ